MNRLKSENTWISTILAFILVPISGFAIDVYIPSFPEMAIDLHTSAANIKLTMTIFLISYGVSQLFVGSILDSYGRYKISLISLLIFSLSSFLIAMSSNLHFIFLLRLFQGIAISFIVVGKRTFFIDVYTGEKRKHYTSLLTVVWSTAPIIAPFLGGYLQKSFGWRSNFYFLGIYGLVMLILECIYSGETILSKQKFNIQNILSTYYKLLSEKVFSIGIIVLGLSYGMVMVFGMSIPFIIEHQYKLSPVASGYCALASGVSIFIGGLFSKYIIDRPFFKKLSLANLVQFIVAILMIWSSSYVTSLASLIIFVMLIHLCEGMTYNIYFTYSLTRFPEYAGTASGIASGGSYIIFSMASYAMVKNINITNQRTLGFSYLIFIVAIAILIGIVFLIAMKKKRNVVPIAKILQ